MTPYILASIFLLCTLTLIFAAFKIRLEITAAAPKDDRAYWKKMSSTFRKGFIVGAVGSGAATVAILIKQAIFAEICCITLLAALVFPLAMLSRKTTFRPCPETEKLQKRWQLILLLGAFFALLLTQLVFGYFNTMIQK